MGAGGLSVDVLVVGGPCEVLISPWRKEKAGARAWSQVILLRRKRARGEVSLKKRQQGKGASLSSSPWPIGMGKIAD